MDVVIHSDCSLSPESKQLLKGYGHAYLNLFKCLGYGENEYPVADWLRSYHQLEGRWLVVTPIHWQATHNDAMLMACDDALNCSDEQARATFEVFSTFAAEEGMQAYYHDRYTWLLQCDDKPSITALSPSALIHQSMFAHIQRLDTTLFWQRFLTEVQMLFAQSLSHASMINGVWIWGAGQLKAVSHRPILVSHIDQLDMARLLSSSVTLSETMTNVLLLLKTQLRGRELSNALMWFDSISPAEHEILSIQLKPYAVNWYWNNLAYHTKKSSWFTKIFSFRS